MSKHLYQLRFYDPENDYAMISDWFAVHGAKCPPEQILPKLGVVCTMDQEPVAALWLYMDNSVGVCWAEYPVTRPKLKLSQSRDALENLFTYMRRFAASNAYPIMRVTTIAPISRYLERFGFKTEMTNLVSMVGITIEPEEDHGNRG
jgi:hypothetical protein